jgi:hypothetical protein
MKKSFIKQAILLRETLIPLVRIFVSKKGTIAMNLSRYSKTLLFASFYASSEDASWPTYASMSCEASSKSAKKSIKNHNFRISG